MYNDIDIQLNIYCCETCTFFVVFKSSRTLVTCLCVVKCRYNLFTVGLQNYFNLFTFHDIEEHINVNHILHNYS